ncbi:MAG: acetate/propionate family kinase [Burkholderiales bacterium]|nr:acetate/propionate family kinase [Phycisphaerae bacterium]
MNVLVANLGSTSFKFKVLDMDKNGEQIARGGYERIGQPGAEYATHGDVIDVILRELPKPPDAIGFKAVHGGPISGAVKVDDHVIDTMQQFADIAPAHNPPYIAAMKAFAQKLPSVPQVACFETAFHQTIPMSRQVYGVPWEWTEKLGIRRYGFHGASHRFIATRVKEIAPEARKVISCHLGGSSSITAIQDGRSIATSMGLTPQTGLLQNNRTGDFDTFALLKLLKQGMTAGDVLSKLGKEGGLLGISGVSNDMRDIDKAAAAGNERAKLAIDAFVEGIRHYVGAYMVALGGCDALVFTAGIGENQPALRQAVCRGLEFAGIKLDETKNNTRGTEARISTDDSKSQVWIIPTNEELIVARQTKEVLES